MNNKEKCYICNDKVESRAIKIFMAKKQTLENSIEVALFHHECFKEACDSRLKYFQDRENSNCLYCDQKVNQNYEYFYLTYEGTFNIINSKMIHYKCYNENIGIYVKESITNTVSIRGFIPLISTPTQTFVSPETYNEYWDAMYKQHK